MYPLTKQTTIEFKDGTVISKPGSMMWMDIGFVGFDGGNGYDCEYYPADTVKKISTVVTSWYKEKEKK